MVYHRSGSGGTLIKPWPQSNGNTWVSVLEVPGFDPGLPPSQIGSMVGHRAKRRSTATTVLNLAENGLVWEMWVEVVAQWGRGRGIATK